MYFNFNHKKNIYNKQINTYIRKSLCFGVVFTARFQKCSEFCETKDIHLVFYYFGWQISALSKNFREQRSHCSLFRGLLSMWPFTFIMTWETDWKNLRRGLPSSPDTRMEQVQVKLRVQEQVKVQV